MSTIQEIESAIQQLSREDMRRVHEWLENLLEDQLVLKEEFKAQIHASELEMAAGKRPRNSGPDDEAAAAWDEAIRERIKKYDAGRTAAIPGSEVFAELDKKLSG